MIKGKITAQREFVIEIDVAGPSQQFQKTQAIVDTGYNGHVTLPPQWVSALNLPFAGYRRATLADGSTILLDVFLADVRWQGQRRSVIASKAAGTPLIGMALLWGNRVWFDAAVGGDAEIETLPSGTP
jgi:clan AA aspartic protease